MKYIQIYLLLVVLYLPLNANASITYSNDPVGPVLTTQPDITLSFDTFDDICPDNDLGDTYYPDSWNINVEGIYTSTYYDTNLISSTTNTYTFNTGDVPTDPPYPATSPLVSNDIYGVSINCRFVNNVDPFDSTDTGGVGFFPNQFAISNQTTAISQNINPETYATTLFVASMSMLFYLFVFTVRKVTKKRRPSG